MKFDDAKENQIVYDRWWPHRLGRIIKKLKTKIYVSFANTPDIVKYDAAHVQFLERKKQ